MSYGPVGLIGHGWNIDQVAAKGSLFTSQAAMPEHRKIHDRTRFDTFSRKKACIEATSAVMRYCTFVLSHVCPISRISFILV